MKRIIAFVTALALMASLTGCTGVFYVFSDDFKDYFYDHSKPVPREQSRQNFVIYEEQLKKALKPYGLTLQKTDEEDDPEYNLSVTYSVVLDDATMLTVDLYNTRDGRYEAFSVEFVGKGETAIDVGLFSDLVNAVSGKIIGKEFFERFLSDPEQEHPAARGEKDARMAKASGEKCRKEQTLDFWDNWSISYTLSESLFGEVTEEFTCYGLTKTGTKL
ncbi:MAG: hypothetical protein IKI63_01540 [Clostridia bacterium]|nr:hypothetical protein [Clostridia bacterium]